MVHKSADRALALKLRQKGHTYREILNEVPVAKSTLSLWLHSVGLSKKSAHTLSVKKLEAARRGGQAKRAQKEVTISLIKDRARAEVGTLSGRELWLVGAALYWGEGSKEKEYAPGSGLVFTNSDVVMARVYLAWLRKICRVKSSDLKFELYIHETNHNSQQDMRRFWERNLKLPEGAVSRIYVKHNKIGTVRKNTGSLYNGTIRIKVARSSQLNRRVAGWIEGVAAAV